MVLPVKGQVGLVTFPPESDARDETRSDDNDDADNSDNGPDNPIAVATLATTTETQTLTNRSTSSTWTDPIRYVTEFTGGAAASFTARTYV